MQVLYSLMNRRQWRPRLARLWIWCQGEHQYATLTWAICTQICLQQLPKYSAVFEKRNTSRTRGLHFQPVPPKVHPVDPREVHGCSQFWKRAGCEFPAFGVWPPGPRPAGSGVWGQNVEVPCGARATAANPARSMAPAVPRAPGASPPAIPVAGWA